MELYFGKLGKDKDPKQFKEGFVQASEEWMSGIQINDYAFVLCNGIIALWKNISKEDYENEFLWKFDIIDKDIGYDTKKFRNLIGLFINPSLVRVQRPSKIGFVKLALQPNFDITKIVSNDYYKIDTNFRKIRFFYDVDESSKYPNDINLQYVNNELYLLQSDFISEKSAKDFSDRRKESDGSNKQKEKAFNIITNALNKHKDCLTVNELFFADFYDAFFCEYKSKNEDKNSDEKKEENFEGINMNKNISLNQILYGPPGTGKTYITKQMAVQICDPEFYSSLDNLDDCKKREQICIKYKELVDSKRIAFTTFHQSMSYEDFIEGIKPITQDEDEIELETMKYKVQKGIFMNICERAQINIEKSQENQAEIKKKLDLTSAYNELVFKIKNDEHIEIKQKNGTLLDIVGINQNNSIVFKAKNSNTENHFSVSLNTIMKISVPFPTKESLEEVSIPNGFREYIGGNVSSVWAVLNWLYDFIEKNKNNKQCEEQKKNYLLIIDEINRGNIPQIFGELITLIEESKRKDADDEQTCILPYSQKEFSVPQNLYILGTMNTADRSVEALDTALRRRFNFIPMMPDSNKLSTNVDGINLKKLLETINKRIEYLLDRDHTIGHAYLINCHTRNDIVKAFQNKIIPQLQEYFYSDWKKIQLVLGESIVKVRKQNSIKDIFGIDMIDDYSEEKNSYYIHENTDDWDFNLPVIIEKNQE